MAKSDGTSVDVIRSFFKRFPRFYYFVATVFGQFMFCGLSARRFLRAYPRAGRCLNLGSGPRVIGVGVTNVDIHPYTGVDVVADISRLPFADGEAARVVCDNVLEHLAEPEKAVSEMRRVLQTGGLVYVATPFLYPFHTSPHDYRRWTKEGLAELFRDFDVVDIGSRAGPFSAITVIVNYALASLLSFGNEKLYWVMVNALMFLVFPVKLLDSAFNYLPFSDNAAASLYAVLRKK